MDNIYDLGSYDYRKDEKYFLDTNVLIFIHGPTYTDDHRARVYSNSLKKIQFQKSEIFIDLHTISEFVNRFSRIEYQRKCESIRENQRPEFKEYRNSTDYKQVAQEIAMILRSILKYCQICNAEITKKDIIEFITDFEKGGYDFTDQIIHEICRKNDLVLISDDSDWAKYQDLKIVTANRRMFPQDG